MISNQPLDSFESLSLPVLYHMPLVQNAIIPFYFTEEVYVFPHDIVGGDDQIVIFHLGAEAFTFKRRPHVLERLEVFARYEFVHFEYPMT